MADDLPPGLIDAIKGFEGFTPKAAWDYQQYSSGYGTKGTPGETIDQDEAQRRLVAEAIKAAKHVDTVAPDAPPGARSALISLTYNAGPGWANSGLGDLVRAGDWEGAKDRLLQYNKAGGEVSPGLAARRQTEASWFDKGAPSTGATAPSTTPAAMGGGGGVAAAAPEQMAAQTGGQDDIDRQFASLSDILGTQQHEQQQQVAPLAPIRYPTPPGLAAARMANMANSPRVQMQQRLLAALRAPQA